MFSPEEVWQEYAASLVEPDEVYRLTILERVWADECELVLPEGRMRGRDAINAHITAIRAAFNRGTPVLVPPIDAHNGFLRFEWRVLDTTGAVVAAGVNFGEQGADGRLRRLVLFRGIRPGQYL